MGSDTLFPALCVRIHALSGFVSGDDFWNIVSFAGDRGPLRLSHIDCHGSQAGKVSASICKNWSVRRRLVTLVIHAETEGLNLSAKRNDKVCGECEEKRGKKSTVVVCQTEDGQRKRNAD